MLTRERLRHFLIYDPETGVFTRRISSGTARSGDVAGCTRPDGYIYISVEGRQYLAHRLAWLDQHGYLPPDHTDHIDGDRRNNRIANLRPATCAENLRNSRTPVNNTSGAKGVYWSKKRRKWVAQIAYGRSVINLGGFTRKESAIAARRAAEAEFHGEFACKATQ